MTTHAITDDIATVIAEHARLATLGPWEALGLKPDVKQMLLETQAGYAAVGKVEPGPEGRRYIVSVTGALGAVDTRQSIHDAQFIAAASPPIVLSLLETLRLARAAIAALDDHGISPAEFATAVDSLRSHLNGVTTP